MASREFTSIDQLMDGAVSERFREELKKVSDNLFDMSTDANKVRTLTLTFSFRPTDDRQFAELKVDVKSRLVPATAMKQMLFMAQEDSGAVHLIEQTSQVPGQIDIYGEEQAMPKEAIFEFKPAKAD